MAQVPVLDANVNLSSGSGFRATAIADTSGSQQLGQAISTAGEELNRYAIEQQAKLNQIQVADASAMAQQTLTDTQNKLLQQKGVNALGKPATANAEAVPSVTEAFSSQAGSLYQSTLDNLTNDVQRNQFRQWYNSTVPVMEAAVQKHQLIQTDIAHKETYDSMLTSTADTFKSSILNGDYNQASVAMKNGLNFTSQMAAITGDPVDKIAGDQKNFVFNTINQVTDQLLQDQRPDAALKTIDYYKAHLPSDLVDALKSKVQPQITKVAAQSYVDSLLVDSTYKLPDGTLNVPALNAKLEDYYLNRKVTQYSGMANSDDPVVQGAIKAGQALNIPPAVIYAQWANESTRFGSQLAKENFNLAGLTQKTPNGEENKQPDGGSYYKQYKSISEFADDYVQFIKTNDSSAMGAQSPSQMVTALKENGYFTGDLQQYIANSEALYNEYAPQFQGEAKEITVPDQAGLMVAKQFLTQRAQDAVIAHKNQVVVAQNSLSQALLAGQVTDISSLKSYVGNLDGISDTEREGLMSTGMSYFGMGRTAKAWQQADSLDRAYGDLRSGRITTRAELDANYGGQIAESTLYTLDKAFTSQYKWASPENMAALEGIVKSQGLTKVEQARIMEQINGLAASKGEDGQKVTVEDVVDAANKASTKIVYEKNRIMPDKTTSMVNVPTGAVQNADGSWTDDQGIPIVYDEASSEWQKKE